MATPSASDAIVVTGLGALTPIGHSVDAFWSHLLAGTSGAGRITKFDTTDFRTEIACEVRDFDPEDHGIDFKSARRQDLFSQYALAVAREALRDADLVPDDLPDDERNQFGVVFGTGIGGGTMFMEQAEVNHNRGPRRISPFFVPMMISNMAAGLIAMEYGLGGPNHCTVSACASGNDAIADGLMLLKQGQADRMLVGGTEASINELCVGGFGSMRALSTRNDDPQTASRPFDVDRDGFVAGEGAGALVLERREAAEERGARIYAELCGFGKSNDAHHYAAPDPEGQGAARAMRQALDDADVAPESVDHINLHATSTPAGDPVETAAVKHVFGEHAYAINCSATKSMTGHLLGAAGAIEAVATVLAVVNDEVPPTINTETLDDGCDLDYTLHESKQRPVNVALANAFGFGGHNTTLAFRKVEG